MFYEIMIYEGNCSLAYVKTSKIQGYTDNRIHKQHRAVSREQGDSIVNISNLQLGRLDSEKTRPICNGNSLNHAFFRTLLSYTLYLYFTTFIYQITLVLTRLLPHSSLLHSLNIVFQRHVVRKRPRSIHRCSTLLYLRLPREIETSTEKAEKDVRLNVT